MSGDLLQQSSLQGSGSSVKSPDYVFHVNRWKVFKRTARYTLPILVWPVIVQLDRLLDASKLAWNLVWVLGIATFVLGIPLLRVAFLWRRRVEIGPDWIWGPTENLFENHLLPRKDVKQIEFLEDGNRVFVRSNRSFAIVVSPADYSDKERLLLLDQIARFDPKREP